MKSCVYALISLVIAVLGYFLIPILNLDLDGQSLFALGAILSGIICQFICKNNNVCSSENAEEFTTTTLYVGNLPYRANEMAIRTLFSEQGKVLSVRLMKDKHTGKRRGFGFVEMPENDAVKAIEALNEKEFQDRSLKVREANERIPRVEE